MMLREKIIKILGLLSGHFSIGVTEAFLLDHCPLIVITRNLLKDFSVVCGYIAHSNNIWNIFYY